MENLIVNAALIDQALTVVNLIVIEARHLDAIAQARGYAWAVDIGQNDVAIGDRYDPEQHTFQRDHRVGGDA